MKEQVKWISEGDASRPKTQQVQSPLGKTIPSWFRKSKDKRRVTAEKVRGEYQGTVVTMALI